MRYTGQRFDDAIGLYYYNASFSASACLSGMQQVESAQSLEGGSKAEFSQAAVINEGTSTVGGYTKYYYAGGDLVAFDRSSGYGQGLRHTLCVQRPSFGFVQDKPWLYQRHHHHHHHQRRRLNFGRIVIQPSVILGTIV